MGCGDGFLGAVLLERFPDASGVFVDFSEPMLDAARERLSPFGKRCQIRAADLSRPDWKDSLQAPEHFDVVISGFAIHHLLDERKRALYSEVLELLSPGGFFLNVEHVSSPTTWLVNVFDELLIDSFLEHQRSTGHDVTREQVAEQYVHRPDKQENVLAPVEEQCAWLRRLGFEDVDCYFKLFELAVFGGRRPS
jgi:SAM-dependent methyltransferase